MHTARDKGKGEDKAEINLSREDDDADKDGEQVNDVVKHGKQVGKTISSYPD